MVAVAFVTHHGLRLLTRQRIGGVTQRPAGDQQWYDSTRNRYRKPPKSGGVLS